MAASNDSQGLKIAVAAFVSLTVILAVVSYFLYSNYDQASAKLAAAQTDLQTKTKAASDILTQYEELRKQIGSRAEEHDAVKTEIKNESAKIDAEIAALPNLVAAEVGKVQAAAGNAPDLQEALARAQQASAAYLSEPNKNYISSIARLKDLVKGQVMLTTAMSRNYLDVKRTLESTDDVKAKELGVLSKSLADAKADLEAEQKKHVNERESLLAKVDQLQTENARQATELATLNSSSRQYKEESEKKLPLAQQNIRDLRYKTEQTETILDRPDGRITHADYRRGEVYTNLTYGMGARPQMVMSIFDAGAAGTPTEKPKGKIELTYVGDRYSVGRIVKTFSTIDPIRVNDIVYSPAWSPNEPMRFALVGKIDINRDGKDDRADLKRMIQAAGGIVDYDLPPPDVGKETGKLTGADAWYVFDDRKVAISGMREAKDDTSAENSEFLKQKTDAEREARLNGVRPMPIQRLLSFLGYDFSEPIRGRVEAMDTGAMRNMLRARPAAAPKPAAPAEGEQPAPPAEGEQPAAPNGETPQ